MKVLVTPELVADGAEEAVTIRGDGLANEVESLDFGAHSGLFDLGAFFRDQFVARRASRAHGTGRASVWLVAARRAR